MQLIGAVFNLNGRVPYVHWHFFQMSAANLSVIGAMLVVFALAILLPFPGSGRGRRVRRAPGGEPGGGRGAESQRSGAGEPGGHPPGGTGAPTPPGGQE